MRSEAKTPEEYMAELPDERKQAINRLRETIKSNLPKGFEEVMNYGMIGFVVPHSIYPDGYHCNPSLPLPFINLASQKNYIAFYHMGIYSIPEILNWFCDEYAQQVSTKLDMGKSCIRFKKVDQIPYSLIGELCKKISVQDWIEFYESSVNRRQKKV